MRHLVETGSEHPTQDALSLDIKSVKQSLQQKQIGSQAPMSEHAASVLTTRGPLHGPVLKCDGAVLCQIVCQLAELCSLLGQHKDADLYYDK